MAIRAPDGANKAEEETKASLGERRQVQYFNCLMFGAMFIMIILC